MIFTRHTLIWQGTKFAVFCFYRAMCILSITVCWVASDNFLVNEHICVCVHSADYAVARCPSVCPSVCHTPVLSLNGYTYHQRFFTTGSPTILVSPHQTG